MISDVTMVSCTLCDNTFNFIYMYVTIHCISHFLFAIVPMLNYCCHCAHKHNSYYVNFTWICMLKTFHMTSTACTCGIEGYSHHL